MKSQSQLENTPIQFNQLTVLRRVSEDYSHLAQDYVFSRVTADISAFYSPQARRFDGCTIIICLKGTIRLTLDLETIDVPPMSLIFVAPERVIKPIEWTGQEREAYLLFLSNRFVYDLNIDLNSINTNIFTSTKSVLTLSNEQGSVLIRYFELLHQNAQANTHYTRHIARAIASAAAYQIMAYGEENSPLPASTPGSSRKLNYVKNFLHLVRAHHRRERSIGFYADKMFISPKYLSLIIKEATGRSAAEWIDQYVLQEAKNLLRYSGKNVQQIAYDLNFTNQSSFGKYFKHLTGMSPTQFQNRS